MLNNIRKCKTMLKNVLKYKEMTGNARWKLQGIKYTLLISIQRVHMNFLSFMFLAGTKECWSLFSQVFQGPEIKFGSWLYSMRKHSGDFAEKLQLQRHHSSHHLTYMVDAGYWHHKLGAIHKQRILWGTP